MNSLYCCHPGEIFNSAGTNFNSSIFFYFFSFWLWVWHSIVMEGGAIETSMQTILECISSLTLFHNLYDALLCVELHHLTEANHIYLKAAFIISLSPLTSQWPAFKVLVLQKYPARLKLGWCNTNLRVIKSLILELVLINLHIYVNNFF